MAKVEMAEMQKTAAQRSDAIFVYGIVCSPECLEQLSRLEISEPSSFEKAMLLIEDLKFHPRMDGLGRPKPLKGEPKGRWSRRITQKHRLVYRIDDKNKVVLVLRAYGHYDDK